MYRLHCPICDRTGSTNPDRQQAQALADTHNQMIHRGQEVATVRPGGWTALRELARRR